jgi:hypothetical protein
VRGEACQVNPASAVPDDDQRVNTAEQRGIHVDEPSGEDAAILGGQELPPGRADTAGSGIDPSVVQDLPYRGGGDPAAEPDQFASSKTTPGRASRGQGHAPAQLAGQAVNTWR